MAEVVIRDVSDHHVEFTTNAQGYKQGRLTVPQWIAKWWKLDSGKTSLHVTASSRTKTATSVVTITSGTEIAVGAADPLFAVLKPGARVSVRINRP